MARVCCHIMWPTMAFAFGVPPNFVEVWPCHRSVWSLVPSRCVPWLAGLLAGAPRSETPEA
eukprot:6304508-Karenia_brevis.AAC.1